MTINKSFSIATLILLAFCAILFVYSLISKCYTMALYSKYKGRQNIYVYDTFHKALNNAFYSTNIEKAYAVNRFYDSVMQGEKSNTEIELITLPVNRPVKLIGYSDKDSNIIEFIDIKTCCWGYVRGYVSRSTVHLRQPSDTLLKPYNDFWRDYSRNHPSVKKYGGVVSEYGFYCNCP